MERVQGLNGFAFAAEERNEAWRLSRWVNKRERKVRFPSQTRNGKENSAQRYCCGGGPARLWSVGERLGGVITD